MAEMLKPILFDAIDLGSNPPFAKLFFLLFQISYHMGMAISFNKLYKAYCNKVSGSVRVDAGRALLSQKGGIHLIIRIKIIIYIQYIIIAFCFIMYYNT